MSKSKRGLKQLLLLAPVALLLAFSAGCTVEREQAGEAPDVDVSVDPGQVPEYDVEGPDVDVTTEKETVDVPDVDVSTEEKTIEVPNVDVNPPQSNE